MAMVPAWAKIMWAGDTSKNWARLSKKAGWIQLCPWKFLYAHVPCVGHYVCIKRLYLGKLLKVVVIWCFELAENGHRKRLLPVDCTICFQIKLLGATELVKCFVSEMKVLAAE